MTGRSRRPAAYSNITSYVYNGFGDVIQETSPDRGTRVYPYDTDGNLTQKVDALSITANHTYDALDRMLTTSYPADTSEMSPPPTTRPAPALPSASGGSPASPIWRGAYSHL